MKPEEKLVIVTDTATSPEIADALVSAALELGIDPTHVRVPPRASSGAEPPVAVRAAMVAADVCICIASRSLYHTNAKGAAHASGTRRGVQRSAPCLGLDGWCDRADFLEIREVAMRVADHIRGADQIRVTSPSGTDITVGVGGREPKAWSVRCLPQPGRDLRLPGWGGLPSRRSRGPATVSSSWRP